MSYTFDKEKNVTVRFFAGGFPVYSRQGTYEIRGDGAIITFSFPTDNNESNSYLPNGMNSISGAFSFKDDDDKIWIGNVCYQKDGTLQQDNNGVSSSNPNILEEPVELQDIRLKLPESYSVSYQVTDESFGISQTYTQTVTLADEGIFIDLNSNERYVFELLDSGKYMQYRYNFLTGKYETAMPAVAIGDHTAA